MTNQAIDVTVLVPTFNEQDNLRDCLACLTWADQIIVVDSFSTDRTPEIARELASEVYQHEYVNSATQKNWALRNLPIRGRWTMIVDADERVTPELADEVRHVVSEDDPTHVGYFVNRRNYFFGKWVRRGGMYPNWNLRLFRTGQACYEDKEVHADVAILGEGRVGYLAQDMEHYSYRTISEFLRKLDRYTTWDARERLKSQHDDRAVSAGRLGSLRLSLRRLYWALPGKPAICFLHRYIAQRGFLDGRHGLAVAGLYAFEEFVIGAKMWEQRSVTLGGVEERSAHRG